MKYLSIRHLDFWSSHYKLDTSTASKCVEVWIYDDVEATQCFLGLNIGTTTHLKQWLDDELRKLDDDHADIGLHQKLLHYYNKLKLGEAYFFISHLYFNEYTPDIDTCNSLRGIKTASILEITAPPQPPYCVNIYIDEDIINSKETLLRYLAKIFDELGIPQTEFAFINEPSKEYVEKHGA